MRKIAVSSFARLGSMQLLLPILCLVFPSGATYCQGADGKPVKLSLTPKDKTVLVGEKADIEIVLQDADNKPVHAPKDYEVTIEIHLPSGKTQSKATIKKGASSGKITPKLDETGIIEIEATHRELRKGSTFINVRRQKASGGARSWVPDFPQHFQAPSLVTLVANAGLDGQKPKLQLRCSPTRRILADGMDVATITAFVDRVPDTTATDIVVTLHNTGGTLIPPRQLIISKTQDYADATLTSDQIGTVTVKFMNASPPVELQGDSELTIDFGPRIHELQLKAGRTDVTLLEECELIAQLKEVHGTPVKTDQDRSVSLTIAAGSGKGEIDPSVIKIAKDSFQGSSTFHPTGLGEVTISSSTSELADSSITVRVTLPALQLALAVLGGAVGGWIAFLEGKNLKWQWRVPLGVVTGFVLYWGCASGGVPYVPRWLVRNPLGALGLSILGGWMGTEVLSLVTRWLGIVKARANPT
jgi:hypothetical protein